MDTQQIAVKIVLDRWFGLINNFEKTINSLTDDQLQKEVAPGKNRGIYLLGHMTAAHDDMFRVLALGDKLHPELLETFIMTADKAITEMPDAQELRTKWNNVNIALTEKINSLQPADWFAKHATISEEDFANEPHRNKLNVMMTRAGHLAYHDGQMALLKA